METPENSNITAIDQAINAAKARKAAKAGTSEEGSEASSKPAKAPKAPKEPKPKAEPKRPRLSEAEKAAKVAARDAERATKKAERELARAAKKAAKAAETKTPHMSKVEKAASKLPSLTATSEELFNDITVNYPSDQIAALAAHLTHFNRVKATERALNQKIATGDTVRIVGGDARFIGLVGEVAKAQRIRCYVEVAGAKKPVYLFTSDVELVSATSTEALTG
jgi:hypothetical protein